MAGTRLTEQEIAAIVAVFRRNMGNVSLAAKELGVARSTMDSRKRYLIEQGHLTQDIFDEWRMAARPLPPEFHVQKPVLSEYPDDEQIWEEAREGAERKDAAAQERDCIRISVDADGPVGIALVGDVHIDQCDIPLLERDTNLILNTEGMFAFSLGDLANNWVGRMLRLYGEQDIGAERSWRLLRHWLGMIEPKLMALVLGNHDLWARSMHGGSLAEWILANANTAMQADQLRLSVNANGHDYTFLLRHKFLGSSIYNEAHGQNRMAKLDGWSAVVDVLAGGHWHKSGYNIVYHEPLDRMAHCIQVASYKLHDRYPVELGKSKSEWARCPVLLLHPDDGNTIYRVRYEPNPLRAARDLELMRADWKRERAASRRKQKRGLT